MLRQAEEFRTVNISGGVGGNGGRGSEQGGSGGIGEGPTTHFGVVKADTMHLVIQNNWPNYVPFQPAGAGETSYESSGTSYNSRNIFNLRGVKRRRDEIEDASDFSSFTRRTESLRMNDDDEIEIIPSRNLKLIREIGSGPGYFLHVGQNKGYAVIVKVFNRGPASTVRRQLESTVALSKGIMHPNLLRLLGISSRASLSHFIVYENVHWQNAEGPLAVALKNDLGRSIMLGFKMVAGLSAGLNHLLAQEVFARPIGAKNFDIFLDVDDRFVISVHPQLQEEGDVVRSQEREGNAWTVFNALCSKTLTSANRMLYHEEIHRVPTILDDIPSRPASNNPALSLSSLGSALGSAASLQNTQKGLDIPPRREYVWRSTDRGQQSLEKITRRMTLDLDMEFSSLRRINQTDRRTPHRCAGYVREEITLATTTLDSAVVAHDAPSASERCLICHEVVNLREEFRCECGDPAPGTRHTVKCQVCKFWSHRNCVGNSKHEFTCRLCMRSELLSEGIPRPTKLSEASHMTLEGTPQSQLFVDPMLGTPLPFYLDKDIGDRAALVDLVKKHGGSVSQGYSAVTYILVNPHRPSGQNLYRQYANKKGRVILDARWIRECIKLAALQTFGTNWAGCKVDGTEELFTQI